MKRLITIFIFFFFFSCSPTMYPSNWSFPDDTYFSAPYPYYNPNIYIPYGSNQYVPYWMHPYEIHIYNNTQPTIPRNKTSSPRIVHQPKTANTPKKTTTPKSSPIRRFDVKIKNK